MNIILLWQVWIWAIILSFVALEIYAGVTKQLTLSQAVWAFQDMYPIATWPLVGILGFLLIHLTNYRLLNPILSLYHKIFG